MKTKGAQRIGFCAKLFCLFSFFFKLNCVFYKKRPGQVKAYFACKHPTSFFKLWAVTWLVELSKLNRLFKISGLNFSFRHWMQLQLNYNSHTWKQRICRPNPFQASFWWQLTCPGWFSKDGRPQCSLGTLAREGTSGQPNQKCRLWKDATVGQV